MSCRRCRGYRRFSTSAYRLLGDFEVAINGGVWVATGVQTANTRHTDVQKYRVNDIYLGQLDALLPTRRLKHPGITTSPQHPGYGIK